MGMHSDDQARIERMVEAGRLTPEEGERLRTVVEAQNAREQTWQVHAASEVLRDRRRFRMLFAFFAAVFVVGLAVGWLAFESAAGGDLTVRAPALAEQTAEPTDGRPIDLSSLDEERRVTMNRTGTLSIVVILLLVVVVLGGGFLLLYNGLVDGRERVNAGWAQVENVYQRRLDLVPVLIDGVKTYMEHERATLAELTEARARAIEVGGMLGSQAPQTIEQLKAVEASQGAVESALARLFAVVENYPDLKASQNFLALQDQLEGTENRIAVERRNYNEYARRYNAGIQKFPGNIVADMIGFKSKPYFEAEPAALQGLKDPFGRNGK
jgi:LemA protein